MKKVLVSALAALALSACSSHAFAWGLSWESVTGMARDKIDPVAYNIEVSGNNLRVYEWITPTEPYQKCVFVASEKNTQLDCDLIGEDPDQVE